MWSKLLVSFLLLICGTFAVSNDSQRIINSTEVTIEEYPFTVSLQWYKYHICGGVIISPEYVLTTAKCLETFTADELKVLAGSTERNNNAAPAQEVQIKEIILHEEYNPQTYQNDIAILVLEVPLVLDNDNVKSVEFYEGTDPIEGYIRLTGTGWGVLEVGASFYPIALHAKEMRSSDLDECISIHAIMGRFIDPQSMICVQCYEAEDKILVNGCTCDGDWGGPLVTSITETDPDMKLVGLASWSYGCDKMIPHVFTNLQGTREFIISHTGLWESEYRQN